MARWSRRGVTAATVVGVVVGMIGLSYAAVPLYRAFCQLTGIAGTTQRAKAAPGAVGERMISVYFDANIGRGMPWEFKPVQRKVAVRVGEETIAFFRAHNPTARPITGTAAFNVTPLQVGVYFSKIQCFCFTEQLLQPGETAMIPVSFFVDPAILKDRNMDDLASITLSYTFFEQPTKDRRLPDARVSRVGAGGLARLN